MATMRKPTSLVLLNNAVDAHSERLGIYNG